MSDVTNNNSLSTNKYFRPPSGRDYGLSEKSTKFKTYNSSKTTPFGVRLSKNLSNYHTRRQNSSCYFHSGSSALDREHESRLYGSAPSEIDFTSYDSIPVEIEGNDGIECINSFSDLNLGPALASNIKSCGYDKPTPIQKHGMPRVFNGIDLMACAQTGSGKTAAYLLPIVHKIYEKLNSEGFCKKSPYLSEPFALVLAPTRELVQQINKECSRLIYKTNLRAVSLYGGSNFDSQLHTLQEGADIIIATPGRLNDFIRNGYVSLKFVEYLVFDEADRMLDMGFLPQIQQILQNSRIPTKAHRQTVMFSATFPSSIQKLARDYLNNFTKVTIGKIGRASDSITQKVLEVANFDKRERILHILRQIESETPSSRVLVFVSTKRLVDHLEFLLYDNKIKVVAIHGDRTQFERDDALQLFRRGIANVMLATDVAQRGLDIPHLTHVINYCFPNDIDEYVHRIGRTGRVGRPGVAITFFNQDNQSLASELVAKLKESNQDVPRFLTTFASSNKYHSNSNRPPRHYHHQSDQFLNNRFKNPRHDYNYQRPYNKWSHDDYDDMTEYE